MGITYDWNQKILKGYFEGTTMEYEETQVSMRFYCNGGVNIGRDVL